MRLFRGVSLLLSAALVVSLFPGRSNAVSDSTDADTSYQIGDDQWGNRWEWEHAESIRILIDGRNVTYDVGPLLNVNGRTLVWGRGLVEQLGGSASWSFRTGTATYWQKRSPLGWDDPPAVLSVTPGVDRGCGSSDITLSWSYAVTPSQEPGSLAAAAGTMPHFDRLHLDAPTCQVFASERVYLPLRAIVEAFKYNMTWDERDQSINISTATRPQPDLAEVARMSFTWDGNTFRPVTPRDGFNAYPAAVLYANVVSRQTTEISRQLKRQDITLSQDDDHLVAKGYDGTVYGHIYPTHVVVFMDKYTARTYLGNLAATNTERSGLWGATVGFITALTAPAESALAKVLAEAAAVAGLTGTAYYLHKGTTLEHLQACYDNSKDYADDNHVPATMGLIIVQNEITGCTDHIRHVDPGEALGGQW